MPSLERMLENERQNHQEVTRTLERSLETVLALLNAERDEAKEAMAWLEAALMIAEDASSV